MKKLTCFLLTLSFGTLCWARSAPVEAINRLDHAAKVLHEVMDAPDQRIPDHIMRHAKCVAVIPHMVKGGFVFGAEEGKGVVTCRTARGWSAPAFIQMGGGSWGTQFGVEAVDLVMVFRGAQGMQKLLSSKFEIGRDASVAAGPVGRHSSENTDVKLNTVILTYSPRQGSVSRHDLRRRLRSPGQRLNTRNVRSTCHDACRPARSRSHAASRTSLPERSERSESPGLAPDREKIRRIATSR